MTNKLNVWDWDLRVRERNLKAGMITEKELEKYLSAVPDSEAQTESFATPQPALDPPEELEASSDDSDGSDDADDSNGSDEA
jgi:hypothetical protein